MGASTVRSRRGLLYTVVVLVASMIGLTFGSFAYANHVSTRDVQNFCALVRTLDQTYRDVPPTSPTGLTVAAEIHQLYLQLHCRPQ